MSVDCSDRNDISYANNYMFNDHMVKYIMFLRDLDNKTHINITLYTVIIEIIKSQ